MKSNYFMIITTPSDYYYDVINEFKLVGFPDRNEKSVKRMNVGDRIIYYVTKASTFTANVEVTGEYFYDKSKIWQDEYDIWPHRLKTMPIKSFSDFQNGVYIKDIWDNLTFIKCKGKWGSQVQGSFRVLSENDYKVIAKALEEKVE